LVDQFVKLGDANSVEQRLGSFYCTIIVFAGIGAEAPFRPSPPAVVHWLNIGIAERVSTPLRMPLLVGTD